MTQLMTSKQIAAALGYKPSSFKTMLAKGGAWFEDAPMFKQCHCKAAGKKRCNHPHVAIRSEFNDWLMAKAAEQKAEYQAA